MSLARFGAPIMTRYGSVVIQLLVISVVTQNLQSTDSARYFTVMGVVLTSYFLVGGGLPDGAVRAVPSLVALGKTQEAHSVLSRALKRSVATVPIGALGAFGVTVLISGEVWTAVGAGAWWAAYGLIFVASQITVAAGRSIVGTALFYSSANLGQLAITLPAILSMRDPGLAEVVLVTGLGTGMAAAAALAVAVRAFRRAELGSQLNDVATPLLLKPVAVTGAAIASGRLVQAVIIWSPVWVASALLAANEAAEVGLASRLVSTVAGVIAAVRFSVRPELAAAAALQDWTRTERTSRLIATAASGLAILAIAGAILLGPAVIPAVFGTDFGQAWLYVAVLLCGTLGESLGGPVDEVLKMSGSANFVLGAQVVAVAIGAPLQMIAASAAGASAQLVVYVLTFAGMYAVLIVHLRRIRGVLSIASVRPWRLR